MEICQVGAELIHSIRGADMKKLIGAVREYGNPIVRIYNLKNIIF